MGNYKKYRHTIKHNFSLLIKSFKKIFYYGSVVDSWLPEIMLLPYITLQWHQDHTWYRVIAPPGSGKSAHLSLLTEYEKSYVIDEMTPKSFVSGFRGSGGKDPSSLLQLDNKVLIITDESTIMEQRQEDRNQVQAILRKTFDGSYGKKFGNIKEKQEYTVYFNMLVASTPQIDRFFLYNQALGERYVNFRLQIPNRKEIAIRAYENQFTKFNDKHSKLRQKVNRFLTQFPAVDITEIKIPNNVGKLLIDVANFITLIRTHISRDSSGQHITTLPQAEAAGRLVKQMTQTAIALAILNGDLSVKQEHIEKVMYMALGSVMAVVVFVLYHIYLFSIEDTENDELPWFSPQTIGIRTTLSLRTTITIIEDLAIHRVLTIRQGKKQGGRLREYSLDSDVFKFIKKIGLFKYYIPPCAKFINAGKLDRTRLRKNRKRKGQVP